MCRLPVAASAALLAGLIALLVVVPLSSGANPAALRDAAASPSAVTPSVAAGSLVASATPTSTAAGSSVNLSVTVYDYPGAAACGTATLAWTLTSSQSVDTAYSLEFIPPLSPSPNGTSTYAWTAQEGYWNYTASLTASGCSTSVSNAVGIGVYGNGGAVNVPGWLYSILQTTWNAIEGAVATGIAAPIMIVIASIGNAVAILETPWGNALASWGIFGPTALVAGLGGTALACYGILDAVGAGKVALGVIDD